MATFPFSLPNHHEAVEQIDWKKTPSRQYERNQGGNEVPNYLVDVHRWLDRFRNGSILEAKDILEL